MVNGAGEGVRVYGKGGGTRDVYAKDELWCMVEVSQGGDVGLSGCVGESECGMSVNVSVNASVNK